MATLTADAYRRPMWATDDELFGRCLAGAAVLGIGLLVAILLAPLRKQVIQSVDQLPPRFARLILEKPKPVKTPAAEKVRPPEARPAAPPAAAPTPAPAAPRRIEAVRPLAPGAGQAGRERAEKLVNASLAGAATSLDRSLDGLSAALGVDASASSGPRRRARGVRGGRGEGELGAVAAGLGAAGGGADLGGSVVAGSQVAIGTIGGGSGVTGGGGGATTAGGRVLGTGSAPGVYRSNASLLAVIQKYAAGIQYCYGNELKRDPSLSGKLVVAMTVAASGEVIEASVVQNTVGSDRLASCALAQIRDWRFPPIAEGVTTFQAPFVFTPPN
jgi:TonB family protein